MMAVHELGHVVGAMTTGGSVERVVLYPLDISRTDVSPNPHPMVVVWAGPVIGCLVPLGLLAMTGRQNIVWRKVIQFFAGYCLIANGAYISIGAIDRVGDCGEMLRTGTHLWILFAFGVVTMPLGFYLWHRLGSLRQFFASRTVVTQRMMFVTVGITLAVLLVEFSLSPR